MSHLQSPGARSNRHQRLPNGVNTTGPLQRGYAQQALHAGANNAANHGARQDDHAINAAPDHQQLGVWEHFDHARTPGATIEHNPLTRRIKLRCPIHAGPDGHQRCRYSGNGFPTMLKVREHVAWDHPSLCPSCQKYLRGPSSWNSHRKAGLAGKACPTADDCKVDDFSYPLWHSPATLDEFHRRRRVTEDTSEEGMKASWGILYRQLHNTSEHDPLPNPLHDYGSTVQSPSSTAASPLPASPPAYSPVDHPFSPSSFGNIDGTMYAASGMQMDVDVEAGASESSALTELAGSDGTMIGMNASGAWNSPSSIMGYSQDAYNGAGHVMQSAPLNSAHSPAVQGSRGCRPGTMSATQGESQMACNMAPAVAQSLEPAVSGPSNAGSGFRGVSTVQNSFAHSNDATNPPSAAWHILQAQEALRTLDSPAIGTARQHLQFALIRLEEVKAIENYWQGQAERAMRVNREIAARLASAIGVQYSTQIRETNVLEDLPLVEDGLRGTVNRIIRWLNSA